MSYTAELHFFVQLMKNSSLNVVLYSLSDEVLPNFDLGIRENLFHYSSANKFLDFFKNYLKPNTIYYHEDFLYRKYVSLLLPATENQTEQILILGPYTNMVITKELIWELLEEYSLDQSTYPTFENYYQLLPLFVEEDFIFNCVNTLGEILWGGADNFQIQSTSDKLRFDEKFWKQRNPYFFS